MKNLLVKIVNILGYVFYTLFLIHISLKGIRAIASGHVWGGMLYLLIALAGVAYWYWQCRPVAWGKQMLAATVNGYDPDAARKVLEKLGAEDKKEFAGTTELLYLALAKGNTKGAALLLELGMDVNAPLPVYFSETTCLQTFCLEPEPDMKAIRFLLTHGANPDAGLAFPPMINALAWGNEPLVQLLLQYGATPGGMGAEINPSGNTPLHSLCSGRVAEDRELMLNRIESLLQGGADVNALTTAGHTALDVALEKKGDEDKPIAQEDTLPVMNDVVALLKQHGALRGCQVRCPRPRFCARVLLCDQLPSAELLQHACKSEPGAVVQAVNHAWPGEGLGGLVDDAAMSDEEKRAALAHTCYIEVSLEESGVVPYELALRFARLVGSLAKLGGCVGVDFGRTVFSGTYAPKLEEVPDAVLCLLVQGKVTGQGKGECLMTEGMEELGFPEVLYSDDQKGMSVTLVQQLVLPMLLDAGTCLEHGHRAFVSPQFSLVATCEPLGPGGQVVLCLRADRNHYRD